MSRLLRYALLITVLPAMAGCTLPRRASTPPMPSPALPPSLLSATAPPTSTPLPTYTPFPTTRHMPTNTPYPTFPPRLALSPTPVAVQPAASTSSGARGPHGPSTPSVGGYIGIQDVSAPVAELEPILEIVNDGVTCGEAMLMQIGVINWGSAPAYRFTVEWSAGLPTDEGKEFIEELQWGDLPLYFRNKEIRFPCQETTTYTTYVRVDVNNEVPELYEDNNVVSIAFTIPYAPED